MKGKKHRPEEIVNMVREAEVEIGKGVRSLYETAATNCQPISIFSIERNCIKNESVPEAGLELVECAPYP